MEAVSHESVAVQPEDRVILGHVPHKQLAVRQRVLKSEIEFRETKVISNYLRNCLFLHVIWHLHVAQPPARRFQVV